MRAAVYASLIGMVMGFWIFTWGAGLSTFAGLGWLSYPSTLGAALMFVCAIAFVILVRFDRSKDEEWPGPGATA